MIRRFKIGYKLELHKRTLERGLLSLIGPQAAAIAGVDAAERRVGGGGARARRVEIDGIHALAVRTDVGVDLICDSADTEALSAALHARGAGPSASRRRSACASSTAAPATGSTSTTPSSPRRPG